MMEKMTLIERIKNIKENIIEIKERNGCTLLYHDGQLDMADVLLMEYDTKEKEMLDKKCDHQWIAFKGDKKGNQFASVKAWCPNCGTIKESDHCFE